MYLEFSGTFTFFVLTCALLLGGAPITLGSTSTAPLLICMNCNLIQNFEVNAESRRDIPISTSSPRKTSTHPNIGDNNVKQIILYIVIN